MVNPRENYPLYEKTSEPMIIGNSRIYFYKKTYLNKKGELKERLLKIKKPIKPT